MARIPLDTSGGTTTTLKAAMDDINTMTSELYTAMQAMSASNLVNMNGTKLRRSSAFLSAPTAADYVTMAVKFRCPATPSGATPVLIGDNDAFVGISFGLQRLTDTTSTGFFTVRTSAGSAVGLGASIHSSGITNYTFNAGTYYTVHIAADRLLNTVKIWVNGAPMQTEVWAQPANALNLTLAVSTTIGGTLAVDTNNDFKDLIGFVYFGAGSSSVWSIEDPLKFYNAGDVYLGPSGQTPNNLQPLVFLGGSHSAADWNTGVNFGYGGDFTVVAP